MMDIYVKSRGVSKDYSWLDKNQNQIIDPPNLKSVIELVDSDYFSVVIYRINGQLSLLVTGLETKNRTDNRTRKIKNSVLWVGDASDEVTLRVIAIQALNRELANQVDQAIDSEKNDQGFTVKFAQLTPENLSCERVEQKTADSNSKIGNLSALKNELINDLKQYSLPIKEGMLVVVVSSTVSQSSLEREKVWRGLSDTISGDQWIPLKDNFRRQPSDSNPDTNISSQSEKSKSGATSTSSSGLPTSFSASSRNDKRSPEDSPLKKWIPIIIAFVIGLLIGIVGHYLYYSNIPNMQKNQIEQNKETIGKQGDKIAEQIKTINSQNGIIAKKEETIKQEKQLIEDIFNYTKEFTDKSSLLIERINGIQK